ncbi:MAG: hypothetical protein ACR2LM_03510 [Pyrinomonadaceae bacterium]
MNNEKFRRMLLTVFACLLAIGLAISTYGQGRGRGGGGGRGSGGGAGSHGGPPGVGVDRGLGNASERSGGRSDKGLDTASEKSRGRSDDGLERARLASNNLKHANEELRNNPGIARTLHTSANDLRNGYQSALLTNPNLKFGNYVAATRLSQNLRARHPGITRNAILSGLASGRSLGQTLQDLGLNERQANDARKLADREIKRAKR